MDQISKKSLIKKFVIAISRPLDSVDESLRLIENVLNDLKPFKLDSEDYGYLWKGIFYSIWFTEMGKGCETIVERLNELANSKLIIHGFEQLNKDWFTIDYIRIDKYMYLVRRLVNKLIRIHLNQFIKYFKSLGNKQKSQANEVDQCALKMRKPNPLKSALSKMDGVGLIDHFIDIFYTECFKIVAPLLALEKQKQLIAQFLVLINRTLIARLVSSSKDDRVLKVIKIELFDLHNHLKRNRYVLEETMNALISDCNRSSSKEIRSIGSTLERRLSETMKVRTKQPDILEPKVKLTYNRKKALKNKSLRRQAKKRKQRAEQEAKLKEEQSKITEISPEEQFNDMVGI